MSSEDRRYRSLSEFLFDRIANNILNGKYQPGQKLVENDIQTEFGVSKSPVREALQMLANSGIVEHRARRGCYVKSVTPKDVEDHFLVRGPLEGIAAQAAYRSTTADDFPELQSIYDEMKETAEKGDVKGYLEAHDRFHGYFALKCGNDLLMDICDKLRARNTQYRLEFVHLDIFLDYQSHEDLLHHFKTKDVKPEEVRILMENHVQEGLDRFRDAYGKFKIPGDRAGGPPAAGA